MLALKRLPPKEAYDRVFRLRRAFQVCKKKKKTLGWIGREEHGHHAIWTAPSKYIPTLPPNKNKLLTGTNLKCSLAHQLLPKDQQTKPEEVRDYINIYIAPPPQPSLASLAFDKHTHPSTPPYLSATKNFFLRGISGLMMHN